LKYLKTYFYVTHELPFIKANLIEAYSAIDFFIVCEYDKTHTGLSRQLIGREKLFENLPSDLLDKVIYLPLEIGSYIKEAYNNEKLIHKINEPVMRSIFMKHIKMHDDDIVISVDADEIIYRDAYIKIFSNLEDMDVVQLKLHQFFYKKTYLWKNANFIAPVAAKYSYFKKKFPCNLRYEGEVMKDVAGCHFSWCMEVDEMIYKLHTYSHPQYRNCADRILLTEAIKNKTYPFDPNTDFQILEIPENSELLPLSMRAI
jgi:hypothetical protein